MLAIIYKLAMVAQPPPVRLRGFEHLAKISSEVKFNDGVHVQRETRTSHREEVSRVGT